MRLSQLMRILWVHRSMALSIMVLVLAIAVAASLLLPKKYTGEAAVVVDARSIDPLAQQGAMTAQLASTYVSTQVDVIESHNVALKVVDRMKLATDPAILEKFQDKTGGVGSIRDWAAEEILKSLTVKPSRDSNVIFIAFTSKSPQAAADIANAFAEEYHTGQSRAQGRSGTPAIGLVRSAGQRSSRGAGNCATQAFRLPGHTWRDRH